MRLSCGVVIGNTMLILLIMFAFAPSVVSASADDVDLPPVESLSLKTIRQMLSDRGVRCGGCVEKRDFEEKLKENIHLPVKKPEVPKEGVGGGGGNMGGMNKEDQRKLIEMLGKDDSCVFLFYFSHIPSDMHNYEYGANPSVLRLAGSPSKKKGTNNCSPAP